MKKFLDEIDFVVQNKDFEKFQQLEGDAQAAIEEGKLEDAAKMFGTFARVYKMISGQPDTAMAADYYIMAANCFKEAGNDEKFKKSLESAIKMYEMDEESKMPWIQLEIARCYGLMGDKTKQTTHLTKVESSAKKVSREQPAVVANIYEDLSATYVDLKDEGKAKKLLQSAVKLYKNAGYVQEAARLYNEMGDSKNFEKTAQEYETAMLASFEEESRNNHHLLAGVELMNLGFFLYNYNKDKATTYLTRAFDSFLKEIGSNGCTWDVVNFATVGFLIERTDDVLPAIKDHADDKKQLVERTLHAMKHFKKDKHTCLEEMAQISFECHQYCDDIVEFLQKLG